MDEQQKKADRHSGIADPGHDKRLARGAPIDGVPIPESDQQVTAKSHPFPAKVKKQQIVGKNQDTHRADKEIHVGEKARITVIANHELRRIEVDQETDDGHDQDHYQ